MCGCNKAKTATTWTVTYPPEANKAPEVKVSRGAAQIAASKVPGATYTRTSE